MYEEEDRKLALTRSFKQKVRKEYPGNKVIDELLRKRSMDIVEHLDYSLRMSPQEILDAIKESRISDIEKAAKSCIKREELKSKCLELVLGAISPSYMT